MAETSAMSLKLTEADVPGVPVHMYMLPKLSIAITKDQKSSQAATVA